MKLRREIRLGLSALVVLQILLSMLAISLLTRMGPAIERILEENVYSVEAVEEMVSVLAVTDATEPTPDFVAARARARDNVTELEEEPLIDVLETEAKPAFAGDGEAKARLVVALRQLGDVNRQSMRIADTRAQELGQAGAWAAALLGAMSLALGILVYRRLRQRLEVPLAEIHRTIRAVRRGNGQARCGQLEGPTELGQVREDLNWLLDRRPVGESEVHRAADRDVVLRRALTALAQAHDQRVLLLDEDGHLVFGDLTDYEAHREDPEGWTAQALDGTNTRMLVGRSVL